MAKKVVEDTAKYGGMTRNKYRKLRGKMGSNSTPGKSKGENCQATGLDKAMAKYPRAAKVYPTEYLSWCFKKDKASGRLGGKK